MSSSIARLRRVVGCELGTGVGVRVGPGVAARVRVGAGAGAGVRVWVGAGTGVGAGVVARAKAGAAQYVSVGAQYRSGGVGECAWQRDWQRERALVRVGPRAQPLPQPEVKAVSQRVGGDAPRVALVHNDHRAELVDLGLEEA